MLFRIPLNQATRFVTDSNTVLHLHTEHVSSDEPTRLETTAGAKPKFFLKTNQAMLPQTDALTPYRAECGVLSALHLNADSTDWNYITTHHSKQPPFPDEGRITGLSKGFWLSLFVRPDSNASGPALIAGVPGMFGLYQSSNKLELRLWIDGTATGFVKSSVGFDLAAWHLVEVLWGPDELRWFINGVAVPAQNDGSTDELYIPSDSNRYFNLGFDTLNTADAKYFRGAVREVCLAVLPEKQGVSDEPEKDQIVSDEEMRVRAMTLFGLATEGSPIPVFVRDSVAHVEVNGAVHLVSTHHPRVSEKGVLVEEARTNLMVPSRPPMKNPSTSKKLEGSAWHYASNASGALLERWDSQELEAGGLSPGKYTVWFSQESQDPDPDNHVALEVLVVSPVAQNSQMLSENEAAIVKVAADERLVLRVHRPDKGTLTHVQIECEPVAAGVTPMAGGRTTIIPTVSAPVTRAMETLGYALLEHHIEDEQGRVDIAPFSRLSVDRTGSRPRIPAT